MTKKMLTMMAALLLSGSAIAAPVDATSAKQKAAAFLQKQAQRSTNGRRAAALRNPQLNEANAFGNALHVFNVGAGNGFVIVSGDDRTEEILGYVEGGNFDLNNIPDNMRFLLQMYADHINSLGDSHMQNAPRRNAKQNIEKLMTTKWDQSGSYSCMLLDDVDEEGEPDNLSYYKNRILTGCVATAMAQVLYNEAKNYYNKYNSWPTLQTNEIPAYSPDEGSLTGHTLPALPSITFDWANMVDNYSSIVNNEITPVQEQAVGRLMQYCGRAVKMEYSDVSAALVIDVPPAMCQYLNMNPYVQSVDRAYFTSQEWEDLLYNEFANGRAVVYGATVGTAYSSEGHCFVLDGYKDGLFHVNWGWGLAEAINNTEYDGYFNLSVLKPGGGGSGSASDPTGAEYKYNQQAVINISYNAPTDIHPALNFYWKSKSSVYTSTIYGSAYGTYNVYGSTLNFDGGWAIRNTDGTLEFLKQDYNNKAFNSIQVADGVNTYMSDLGIASKADGDYDLIHVSRISGTENWYADNGTDKQYITATVANGRVTNVVVHPVDASNSQFSVKNIEFEGSMEANVENKVIVTIENTGDDYFGKISMGYGTGSTASSVLSMLATLKPGETTHEFTVKAAKGEYNLWFMFGDNSSNNAFGTGKMYIGFGEDANLIHENNFEFDGQEGATTLSVKSVNGTLEPITGSFEVTNTSSHDYTLTYHIAVEKGSTTYSNATATAFVAANSTETVQFDLGTVNGLTSGDTYTIRLYRNESVVASKNLTLQPYFRYWYADGTVKEAKEPTSFYTEEKMMDPDAKANAVAIDLRGINEDYIRMTDNSNCLFYLSTDQSLDSEFSSANKIFGGTAAKVNINSAKPFYAPEAFTATEISFTKTFTNGIAKDGAPYWYTIVLPFEVNNVKQGTKNLKWFKSATDKRCHFWLMELTNVTSDALTFDYAQTFEANTPYIIQVPGEGWGDSWNLAGKELTFKGLNVNVPATAFSNETFIGTYASLTTSGLFLDASQNKFLFNEAGTVAPYNAYINAPNNANAMRIVIGDGEDIATGIMDVETGEVTIDQVYDLQGRRVQNPKKGLYIVNGKTVVIK